MPLLIDKPNHLTWLAFLILIGCWLLIMFMSSLILMMHKICIQLSISHPGLDGACKVVDMKSRIVDENMGLTVAYTLKYEYVYI